MEMNLKKMISTVQSTGKKVGEKTVKLVDLSKLKLERGRVLAALDNAYRRLGIYAFEQERNGTTEDGYENCLYTIDALRLKLENYDAQIAALQGK